MKKNKVLLIILLWLCAMMSIACLAWIIIDGQKVVATYQVLDVDLDVYGNNVDYYLICVDDNEDVVEFRKNYEDWTQLEKMLLSGRIFNGDWSQIRLAQKKNGNIYLFICEEDCP